MNNDVCCLWFCVFCKWEWNISKYINVKYRLWIIVSLNVTTSVLFKRCVRFFLIFSHCWFLIGFAPNWPSGITMDNKEPWRINKWKKNTKSHFLSFISVYKYCSTFIKDIRVIHQKIEKLNSCSCQGCCDRTTKLSPKTTIPKLCWHFRWALRNGNRDVTSLHSQGEELVS